MAKARATVTLQESSEGSVCVRVQTREPLGPYEVHGRRWEPEQYLNAEPNAGSVELNCSAVRGSRLWLPELRVSTPFWAIDRHVEISAGSEERRLLELLIGQEAFEIVWPNEGVRARRPIHQGLRKAVRETFEAFPDLDAATWKEAVAESEWRSSQNWRPGPRPRPPKRRNASPPEGVELRFFAARTGALPREGAVTVADIRLPRGSRLGGFWCSDDPSPEAIAVASRLASQFSDTGLWPFLWPFGDEPTGYMSGLGELDWVDDIDAPAVLQREWEAHPPKPEWVEPLGVRFAGVAAPTPRDSALAFDPFQTLKSDRLGLEVLTQ